MSKIVGLTCTFVFLFLVARPHSDKFVKYKAVEAYEIRPGILMMPRYSNDGRVCEVGLERQHYSPEIIRLDSELSRKDIDGIFDELVPVDERGPKSKDVLRDLIVVAGNSRTASVDYENVEIQIYGSAKPKCNEGEVAAVIRWKNRKCQ